MRSPRLAPGARFPRARREPRLAYPCICVPLHVLAAPHSRPLRASRAPASACPCMCSLRLARVPVSARHTLLWRKQVLPWHLRQTICSLSLSIFSWPIPQPCAHQQKSGISLSCSASGPLRALALAAPCSNERCMVFQLRPNCICDRPLPPRLASGPSWRGRTLAGPRLAARALFCSSRPHAPS